MIGEWSTMTTQAPDKQSAILEVALRLISEQGFHGTPMSQVAQEAQVGVGTIYRYFESKEALINSLYRHLKQEVTAATLVGVAADEPVRAKFRRIWLNLAHYYLDHPAVFKFIEQYTYSPFITAETRKLGAEQHTPLRRFFAHAQEQQICKEGSYDVLIAVIYGTIAYLVRRHVYGEHAVNETMLEQAVDACWDAIKR
jgi:AcrR family transcriptional regulator